MLIALVSSFLAPTVAFASGIYSGTQVAKSLDAVASAETSRLMLGLRMKLKSQAEAREIVAAALGVEFVALSGGPTVMRLTVRRSSEDQDCRRAFNQILDRKIGRSVSWAETLLRQGDFKPTQPNYARFIAMRRTALKDNSDGQYGAASMAVEALDGELDFQTFGVLGGGVARLYPEGSFSLSDALTVSRRRGQWPTPSGPGLGSQIEAALVQKGMDPAKAPDRTAKLLAGYTVIHRCSFDPLTGSLRYSLQTLTLPTAAGVRREGELGERLGSVPPTFAELFKLTGLRAEFESRLRATQEALERQGAFLNDESEIHTRSIAEGALASADRKDREIAFEVSQLRDGVATLSKPTLAACFLKGFDGKASAAYSVSVVDGCVVLRNEWSFLDRAYAFDPLPVCLATGGKKPGKLGAWSWEEVASFARRIGSEDLRRIALARVALGPEKVILLAPFVKLIESLPKVARDRAMAALHEGSCAFFLREAPPQAVKEFARELKILNRFDDRDFVGRGSVLDAPQHRLFEAAVMASAIRIGPGRSPGKWNLRVMAPWQDLPLLETDSEAMPLVSDLESRQLMPVVEAECDEVRMLPAKV